MIDTPSRKEITKAIRAFKAGDRPFGNRMARTWFLVWNGELLPLKYIVALACATRPGDFNTSDAISVAHELSLHLEFTGTDLLTDIANLRNDDTKTATAVEQLILARLGQGRFRKALLKERPQCYVTAHPDKRFLIASHIVPWSKCSDQMRLDPRNGILFVPNLDRAFDKGLISFEDDGGIVLSSAMTDPAKLGITSAMRLSGVRERRDYLKYHRCHVFQVK